MNNPHPCLRGGHQDTSWLASQWYESGISHLSLRRGRALLLALLYGNSGCPDSGLAFPEEYKHSRMLMCGIPLDSITNSTRVTKDGIYPNYADWEVVACYPNPIPYALANRSIFMPEENHLSAH